VPGGRSAVWQPGVWPGCPARLPRATPVHLYQGLLLEFFSPWQCNEIRLLESILASANRSESWKRAWGRPGLFRAILEPRHRRVLRGALEWNTERMGMHSVRVSLPFHPGAFLRWYLAALFMARRDRVRARIRKTRVRVYLAFARWRGFKEILL
jgi:hypothetical protein